VTLCGPVKLILTMLARADILGRPVHHGGRDDRGYDRPMAPDTVYDASLLQPMHLAPIRLDLVDHQRRKARTRPPRIATSVVQASGAHWSTRALASPISPTHTLTSYPGSLYAPSDASSVSGSPVSAAAPGPDSPSVYFDVLRSDPRFDGLVHIASSRSRWTAIPLLPRARVARPYHPRARTPRARRPMRTRTARQTPRASTSARAVASASTAQAASARTAAHIPVSSVRSSRGLHRRPLTCSTAYGCPFEGCGRGFSVHSNMRRHYQTHVAAEEELLSPISMTFSMT
jgi:hypothetical protein